MKIYIIDRQYNNSIHVVFCIINLLNYWISSNTKIEMEVQLKNNVHYEHDIYFEIQIKKIG